LFGTVSTTKLHNRHTGDNPVNIVKRPNIPIASEKDSRIKVFLKGPTGLAESGEEVDLLIRPSTKLHQPFTVTGFACVRFCRLTPS